MTTSSELSEKRHACEVRLGKIRELRNCEAFHSLFIPELQRLHREERANCCNPDLTPEKRSESISAVHILERLTRYIDTEETRCRSELAGYQRRLSGKK